MWFAKFHAQYFLVNEIKVDNEYIKTGLEKKKKKKTILGQK